MALTDADCMGREEIAQERSRGRYRRMLKKASFSPTQPQRAETRFVPSKAAGRSATEAYFSHPPTPSCQDSSVTSGYVARRRATENDAWEKARIGAPGSGG